MNFKLDCIGALKQKTDNSYYEFIVRWFIDELDIANKELGDKAFLPSPEGKFKVLIRTSKSNQYIDAKGQVKEIKISNHWDLDDLPEVRPLNYLMLSPPSIDGEMKKPDKPIDTARKDASSGVGIFHVLTDSCVSSYAKKMIGLTNKRITNITRKKGRQFIDIDTEEYAKKWIHFIIKSNIQPRNWQAIFIKSLSELEKISSNKEFTTAEIPDLFCFDIDESLKNDNAKDHNAKNLVIENAWKNVSRIHGIISDPDYSEQCEKEKEERENLKRNLALLSAHSVSVIDYWCDPLNSNGIRHPRIEEDCGKEYPLSHALGLGCSIGNIAKTTLENWKQLGDNVRISVKYIPPRNSKLLKSDVYDWKSHHDLELLNIIPELTSLEYIITKEGANSIKNTLETSKSCPPDPPMSSQIDYNLYYSEIQSEQSLVGSLSNNIENMDMRTGNGRVSIQTVAPEEKTFYVFEGRKMREEKSTVITGINIYGIWESSGLILDQKPNLEDLKPWLITRRYSFHQEIQPFFELESTLKQLNQNPPIQPCFQTTNEFSDHEKIEDVTVAGIVKNATIKNFHKEGVYSFSFNIRNGFDNLFDKDLLKTWDDYKKNDNDGNKSYKPDWTPHMFKDGSQNDERPERYRFWATSIDLFGQESEPIPIKNVETDKETESFDFSFKNRYSLKQPKPFIVNGEKQEYNVHVNYQSKNLSIAWKSPEKNIIGDSVKEISNDETGLENKGIDSARLQANVLILRKEIEDDEFKEGKPSKIDSIVDSLPDEFKNEKWKIGLEELFQHNDKWVVAKFFNGFENKSDSSDSWGIDIKPYECNEVSLGFDYIVLAGFVVKESYQNFWVRNYDERKLIYSCQEKGTIGMESNVSYVEEKNIEETPCIGNVALSNMVTIYDTNYPKHFSEIEAEEPFIHTKPILGVAELNRDVILSNILKIPSEVSETTIRDGNGTQKVQTVNFASSEEERKNGLLYTSNQLQMIKAVYKRSSVSSGIKPADQILKRELTALNTQLYALKKDAENEDNDVFYYTKYGVTFEREQLNEDEQSKKQNFTGVSENLVNSSLIGFRGFKKFNVKYKGKIHNDLNNKKEAEAKSYKVFQSRIKLTQNANISAFLYSESFEKGGGNIFNNVIIATSDSNTDASLKDISEFVSPTVVIVKDENSNLYVSLIKTFDQESKKLEITVPLYKDSIFGEPKQLLFIHSEEIYSNQISLNNQKQFEEELHCPVGGGARELFIWCFVTYSAIGKKSKEVYTSHQEFSPSILPRVPNRYSVSGIDTEDEKDIFLSANNDYQQKWLPINLRKVDNNFLKLSPRIYVRWDTPVESDNQTYLSIDRENRVIEPKQSFFISKSAANWNLASKIEKFDDKKGSDDKGFDILAMDWLNSKKEPSLYGWLFESEKITHPESEDNLSRFIFPNYGLLEQEEKMHLNLSKGIKGDKTFVDYFYGAELKFAMDCLREYRYRLRSYIDIDPGNQFDLGENKYLYSRETKWSEYVRPTFPKICINTSDYLQYMDELHPKIEFSFSLTEDKFNPLLKEKNVEPETIYFRIKLSRQVQSSIKYSEKGGRLKTWKYIDKYLDIPFLKKNEVDNTITDSFIRGKDEIDYKIEIAVILKDNSGNVKNTLRKNKIFNKKVRVSPIKNGKEVKQKVKVIIQ
ncbi:hypothetical protein [Formosa sp. PL04]|uniref:hypothetical protein n=1 Tax=Formosa sp. PL04 TaxID=3081755 RepID=UPI0029821C33|nr:hypothetical protein [Formosa sp. PL04]MDW5288890.1 hypothetical protein [Formosa sp. PL04]